MRKYFLLFLLPLFYISCDTKNDTNGHTKKTIQRDQLDLSKIEGYWIMSEYIDDILRTKKIIQPNKRMTWLAVVFKVKNDSLSFFGTIPVGKSNQVKITSYMDSLTTLKWMGSYQLSYDAAKDRINGKSVEAWGDKVDPLIYNFRRLKNSEMGIVKDIEGKANKNGLRKNMNALFIDSLVAGKYMPVVNGSARSKMTLNNKGIVQGFKNYNAYIVDDYFGTMRMYGSEDAIIFRDTTEIDQFPPKDHGVYAWEFDQDTLILTKMTTVSYESFDKGNEKYKFIKSL